LPPFNQSAGVLNTVAACDRTGVKPDFSTTWRAGPKENYMSYAIIEAGGKQHRVQPGETLKVEKIEAATGASIDFDKVLLVSDGQNVKIGAPYVSGGKVTAEIVSQGRHDKITIIKFRRRKHHMKLAGHRQWFTEIKITGISG
jgi:large subunit ribosomal protein L21